MRSATLPPGPDRSGALEAAHEPAVKLRVLTHPARLAINRALQSRADDATAADLAAAVGLPLPATRRHLQMLVTAGLVATDRSTRPTRFVARPSATRELAYSVHSALGGQDRLATDATTSPESTHLQLLSRVAAQVGDGVAIIDADGWLIYANPAFTTMHGHDKRDLAGSHFTAYMPPSGQEGTLSQLIADARQHGSAHAETWRLRRDGSTFPAAVTLSLLRDDHGQVLGRVLSVQDATARRELEDQLRVQALRDPLTGLANRRLLLDRLEHSLKQTSRTGQPVSVLFCDLDGFKQINDRHGHEVGDQLLQHVAQRLAGQLRSHATLARLGGDEFVAVLPSTSLEEAHHTAGRLRAALDAPLHLAGHVLNVGLSIGVATNNTSTPAGLLAAADAAMYRNKTARTDSLQRTHQPAATPSQPDAMQPPPTPATPKTLASLAGQPAAARRQP